MKRIILSGLILGAAFASSAQQGAFVSFNTGIAFSAAKDAIGTNVNTSATGDFTNTNIYGSFGSGVPININFGFKATQNFGVELGVSYLSGFSTTINESTGPNSSNKATAKSTQIRLKPGLIFETTNEALTLYSKMGLVLPIGGKTKGEEFSEFTGTETMIKTENTGAFSLGFYGAAGVSLKIGDNLKAFAEVESINLRIKQKTSVVTEYTVDGNDQLGALSTQQKEAEYVDEVTSADNTDINNPRKILANTTNFGSFGLNLGIRFNF